VDGAMGAYGLRELKGKRSAPNGGIAESPRARARPILWLALLCQCERLFIGQSVVLPHQFQREFFDLFFFLLLPGQGAWVLQSFVEDFLHKLQEFFIGVAGQRVIVALSAGGVWEMMDVFE